MRERFVFDVENDIIELEKFSKIIASLSSSWIEFDDARMVVAKIELVGARHHAIRIVFFEHAAHTDNKRFSVVHGSRNNRAWRNPSRKHASVNIWRTTHNLHKAIFVAFYISCTAIIVNLTKAKMRAFNFFASFNLNGINFVVFMSLINSFFNFNETSANKLDKLVIVDVDVDKFFDPIERN